MNTHGFYDVIQTEIHTTEPLMPEPSAADVEMAMERLKKNTHTSPSIDKIPTELIKTRRRKISFESHKLIKSVLEYGGIA